MQNLRVLKILKQKFNLEKHQICFIIMNGGMPLASEPATEQPEKAPLTLFL